jgi:hypothetical protein
MDIVSNKEDPINAMEQSNMLKLPQIKIIVMEGLRLKSLTVDILILLKFRQK